MSNPGFSRKKGVSPWLPIGFLAWIVLVLTIFVAFFLAGGQGLRALSFGDAFVFVLLRMAVIALILSPLFLAAFAVWLGYKFLKKRLQTASPTDSEQTSQSKESS